MAGGTFPAEIWGDYMKQAKGKYCGDFTPRRRRSCPRRSIGRYARGGGKSSGDETTDPSGLPRTTEDPAAEQPGDEDGDEAAPDGGNGDGGDGFDPDKYEAPPQQPPDADDGDGGGTQAPGLSPRWYNPPVKCRRWRLEACGKAVP